MTKKISLFLVTGVLVVLVGLVGAQTSETPATSTEIINRISEARFTAGALTEDALLNQVADAALEYLADDCLYEQGIEDEIARELGYTAPVTALVSCGRDRYLETALEDFLEQEDAGIFSSRWKAAGIAVGFGPRVKRYVLILGENVAEEAIPVTPQPDATMEPIVLAPLSPLDQTIFDAVNASRTGAELAEYQLSPRLNLIAASLLEFVDEECNYSYNGREVDAIVAEAGYLGRIEPLTNCGVNMTVQDAAEEIDNFLLLKDDAYSAVGVASLERTDAPSVYIVVLGTNPDAVVDGEMIEIIPAASPTPGG